MGFSGFQVPGCKVLSCRVCGAAGIGEGLVGFEGLTSSIAEGEEVVADLEAAEVSSPAGLPLASSGAGKLGEGAGEPEIG